MTLQRIWSVFGGGTRGAVGLAVGVSLVALVAASPAQAQQERIAAVVNDEVISTRDVETRLRLTLLSAGLEPTTQNQQRVLRQVMRTLIDETLQMQEADRLNIMPEDQEIDRALEALANTNNMSREQFEGILSRNNVPVSAIRRQTQAQLAWRGLIERRVLPDIRISDDDVADVIAEARAAQGQTERLLAEIFVSADGTRDEADLRSFMEQLQSEILGGADFASIARQFSQGAGANAGGDIGWVLEGQMQPEIEAALDTLEPGRMTPPVRTASGFHILLLRDERVVSLTDSADTVIEIANFVLPVPPGTSTDQRNRLRALADTVIFNSQGCDALDQQAEVLGVGQVQRSSGPVRAVDPGLRSLVENLPTGTPSQLIDTPQGFAVLMVCDRQQIDDQAIDPDRVASQLRDERTEMMSRRYLRDLRNAAFIDLRL